MPEHRLYVTTRTLWPYSKSPVVVALIRFHLGDQQKNSVQRSDKPTAPETRKAPSNEGGFFHLWRRANLAPGKKERLKFAWDSGDG